MKTQEDNVKQSYVRPQITILPTIHEYDIILSSNSTNSQKVENNTDVIGLTEDDKDTELDWN